MSENDRFITMGPEISSPQTQSLSQQWKTLSVIRNKSFLPSLNENMLSLRQVRQQKHKIENVVAQSVQRINFIKQDSIKSFRQALKVKQVVEKVYKSRDNSKIFTKNTFQGDKYVQRKILLNGMKIQNLEDIQQLVKDKKIQEERDIQERRKQMINKARTIGKIVKKEQAESENIIEARLNYLQELKKEQVEDVKHLHRQQNICSINLQSVGKEKISWFKSMRERDIKKLKSKMVSQQLDYNQRLQSEKETLESQENAMVELLHQSLALSHHTQQQLQKAKCENFDSQSNEIVKEISNQLSSQDFSNKKRLVLQFNKGSVSSSISLI